MVIQQEAGTYDILCGGPVAVGLPRCPPPVEILTLLYLFL